MPLNVFNWDGDAVERFRHNHSTWIVMPLNVFNFDVYAVDCFRHNHSTWMAMPLNVFGIAIELGWLCR
jgi:hypothetical protein